MRKLSLVALAGVLGTSTMLAPIAAAQFDFGGGSQESSTPWDDFKLNKSTKIKLDFRNANVDLVLSMFQKTSGITIVKDPALTGTLTLTSAKQLSLSEAFQVLSTTLSLKNFEMKKEGNLLVIRQKQQRNDRGSGMGGFDPSMFTSMMQTPQLALKIYQIKYANASQVARVINDVFASAGQQQNPFAQLFGGGGGGGGFGGFGGQNRGGRGGGGNPFQNFRGFGGGGQQATVRASSDDFSNSVIVNAPDKEQRQVADLIKSIDKETEQPQNTKVFKLKYATATEVAPTLQNVLTNNAPRGRGGIGTQNVPIEQRFQQAFRFGSTAASFGTVATDARTNSVIVTATDESLLICQEVLKELDQEVQLENTTFVFQLNNARADAIATLMNQTFGQRQGVQRGGGNFGNFNNNANRGVNQNVTNRPRTNQGLGGENTDPNNLALDLQDPNADSGELLTSIAVAQGGGFGALFGGGQNRTQTQTPTGRNAQGQLVPIRDLTGQITVIPDTNTNSIIVVANPDYAQLIKQILDQLDKIPEQVMIETIIVEVSLDGTNRLGVDWQYNYGNVFGVNGQNGQVGSNFGNQTANPALQGLRYTLSGGNLTGFLNALRTDNKFQVLSTPKIFTSNNIQATINISQSVPYISNTRQDINGGILLNYAFLDVGIILNVTPRITSNGYVTMDVNQTANELQGFTSFNAPIVNQREATTTVSVKNGETVILGGIMRNTVTTNVSKVPLIGDIPVLGKLFQTSTQQKNKTELLVLMTPRIVKDENEARAIRAAQVGKASGETQRDLGKIIPPENKKTTGGGNK